MKFMYYKMSNSIKDIIKVNYIFDFKEKDKATLDVMAVLLNEGNILIDNDEELTIRLLNDYDASITATLLLLGNRGCLSFISENTNYNYLPNKENVENDVVDVMLNFINNNKVLARCITKKKLRNAKLNVEAQYYRKINSFGYTIGEVLNPDLDVFNSIKKVSLKKIQQVYREILLNGRIIVQELSPERDENIEKMICEFINPSKEKIKEFKLPLYNSKVNCVEKVVDDEASSVYVMLQKKNPTYTGKDFVYMCALAEIFDNYMFNIVREEYALSYNPSAYFSMQWNSIFLETNLSEENKEKGVTIIEDIINFILSGCFEESEFIDILSNIMKMHDRNFLKTVDLAENDLQDELTNIKKLTVEEIKVLTLEDFKNYMKDMDVKLFYNLIGK